MGYSTYQEKVVYNRKSRFIMKKGRLFKSYDKFTSSFMINSVTYGVGDQFLRKVL